jgi:hypothetical protein
MDSLAGALSDANHSTGGIAPTITFGINRLSYETRLLTKKCTGVFQKKKTFSA